MPLGQDELDAAWDHEDPIGSEARLRTASDAERDAGRRAELLTQVARAVGLQQRYADADRILDAVEPAGDAVRVRLALERGRVRASSGDPGAAIACFRDAAGLARAAGLRFLWIDALHMLAIVDVDRTATWATEALAALEEETDPRTRRWAVSLHNNLGWARFEAGALDAALAEFEAARDAAECFGTAQQVAWAEEAIVECRTAIAAAARPGEDR